MSRDPVLEGLIRAMLVREAVSSTNLDRDQTFTLDDVDQDVVADELRQLGWSVTPPAKE